MSLIDHAIARSRPVLASLALILIAGTIAFVTIPKESAPDINIPNIYITMVHRGISPEDAERLLIRPMEKELRAIEGVKKMLSTAYDGGANVLLEFDAGFDADKALADVRKQVDVAKGNLPVDTEAPVVKEVNFSLFPILAISLSSDMPERSLLHIARILRDDLEGIPEVLEVQIGGLRDEQVEIVIQPALIEAYGLSASDLIAFVKRSNKVVAAGSLDTGQGRFAIKVPGLLENAQDLLDLPVRASGDSVIKVGDIASVRRTFKDPTGFARVNGKPALVLQVSKRIGTNIIDTVNKVRAVVEKERAFWPEGLDVAYLQDQSKHIQTSLQDLRNSILSAILLVMVVVVAALGVRSGLLVGLAIPGSFLTAILVLDAFGLTINMVVLFGLILAVGMLVDGAIVVTEYADRKMTEGFDRKQAYSLAARRMALPVIASTLTTLAAFLPLVFWSGVVGEFMKYLPITLLATLTASLLMALFFVPVIGAYFGRPGESDPALMMALSAEHHSHVTQLSGFTGFYARVLHGALSMPTTVIVGTLILLVAGQVAYGKFGEGVQFFPEVEPEQVVVKVHARGNLSVTEQDTLVRQVEGRILGMEGLASVYTLSGESRRGGVAADQIGTITIEFTDWNRRPRASVLMEEMRRRTADLAGIIVEVEKKKEGPPVGKAVQLELSSRDPALLAPAVAKVRAAFESLDGLINIEDDRPLPGIQWELKVDRAQAAKFGADVTSIGEVVKLVTTGLKFSDYRPDDSEDVVDIVARFPEEYRSLEQLDRLRISGDGGSVPLGNFVTRSAQPRVGDLTRVDGRRVMTVKADTREGVLPADLVPQLQTWLKTANMPPEIGYTFRGEDEEKKKSEAFLVKAFGVALFLMAIILVTQFNSFYSAFLILSAVIMSTMGVMLGLLIFHEPFGIIMNGIGVIALAGIVVNNNIVLIDTYDRMVHEYEDPLEAILHTGVQRLRPVLLTTITTVLGLLPMMFSINVDFITREITHGAPSMQWWSQLSTSVVCGLSFATVLTLVVTPCALLVKHRVADWRRGL